MRSRVHGVLRSDDDAEATTAAGGLGAVVLGDPSEALERSVMMSDERRAYLAQRWMHWQEYELTTKTAIDGPHARQAGIE